MTMISRTLSLPLLVVAFFVGEATGAPVINSCSISPEPLVVGQPFSITVDASEDTASLMAVVDFRPTAPSMLRLSLTPNGSQWSANGLVPSTITVGSEVQVRITIYAFDAARSLTTEVKTLLLVGALEDLPPEVAITAPAPQSAFSSSPVNVSGTASSDAENVLVNGVTADLSNGNWSAMVPLREGPNVITAVATDAAGNVGTASVQVSLDSTPPIVVIDSPRNGTVVSQANLTVTGMINDIVAGTVNGEQATVVINGVPAQVANRTFIAIDIPLIAGPNTITAVGTDVAGNSASSSIQVVYDPTPMPRISPVSGNHQTAQIGQLLPEPLVVSVTDASNNAVAGKNVIFKVVQNDGVVTANGQTARSLIVQSDPNGRAQVHFTLGTRVGAGNNQVQAMVVGFEGEAMFCASATPTDPGLIVLDNGNMQQGAVNQPLPKPFVTVVVDSGNNRLRNVPVTFTVKEGGGGFDGQTSKTVNSNSDGVATATLTLGPDEGIENNVVEATFPGNTGFPVMFVASGVVPADPNETSVSGVVLDNSNVPIEGVTLHIEGTSLTTVSDAQGQFEIKPAPVGSIKLSVDGSTANRPGTWPHLEFDMVTVAGRDNTVGMPIFLLPIDVPNGLFVDESTGGTLTLPHVPGFSLTVAPGSATFPSGSRSGTVSVTMVHNDKVPMVPNFGQQPRFVVTIQPAGTHFDPPAPICIPNLDTLPPGQKTEMYSFDHDLGQFVSIGTGTVSEDGLQVCSDPGVGIIKGGWHCGGNPATVAAGIVSQISVDKTEVVLCVGEQTTVTATGSPTPPHSPVSFEWQSGGSDLTSGSLSGTSSTATINGTTPGTFTARVRYRCKSAQWSAFADLEVKVYDLTISGPSFVCAGQSYSFAASTVPSGGTIVWSGAVDASGTLVVPATATDGDTFTATASIDGCSRSVTATASDGRPGNTSEAANCLLNPIDCFSVNGLADEALTWAQNNATALGGGLFQGCADAARHAYWNALMAQELGAATAQDFGDAHEFSNFNDCNDNNMDLHNNEVGRTLGATGATRAQIQQSVVDALRNGQLIIIDPATGQPVPSGTCNVTL